MVCEEDHIRIQCILPGLSLKDAYEGAGKVEALLDHALELAFDETKGYLTACPTNLGTAMRASVMLSLPLLTAAGRMEQLALRLGQTGLLLRGLYGEGSAAAGCLYQISNRTTIGLTEEEIIRHLEESAKTLIEAERPCREGIVGADQDVLTDRIRRAEGSHADAASHIDIPLTAGAVKEASFPLHQFHGKALVGAGDVFRVALHDRVHILLPAKRNFSQRRIPRLGAHPRGIPLR
jgi:protein-arginine kinase